MNSSNQILFWDFDGTLGYRRDGMWGGAMIEALREIDPNTSLKQQDFRPFLISGFPWHDPEYPHIDIISPDQWWKPIETKFEQGFLHFGYTKKQSEELAKLTRMKFIQSDMWALFDDTIDTLNIVSSRGWKSLIVSNHIPELKQIISHLGIDHYFTYIVNSADVGYEKPNPRIYQFALDKVQKSSDQKIWMIGDNIEADYYGAESMGINSILVRTVDSRAKRNCQNLREVISILEKR